MVDMLFYALHLVFDVLRINSKVCFSLFGLYRYLEWDFHSPPFPFHFLKPQKERKSYMAEQENRELDLKPLSRNRAKQTTSQNKTWTQNKNSLWYV